MPIECFVWTEHAKGKARSRLLDPVDVERAIRTGHGEPRINGGRADWIVQGLCADGRRFEAVYDHPHWGNSGIARIVSVWDL